MAERKPFLLRIDEALLAEIKRWAAVELRSVNGQIEFILRRAVDERFRDRREPRQNGGGTPGGTAA
ncbi:MAG: hypothetical protein OEO21_07465 [Candidatus Krumholzibacteria bacterium]|nr:hypothetical protein [Candidatus Krumholzibacteria bacterium]